MNFIPKKISIENKGTSKFMGELESAVMEIVWEKKSVSAREVTDMLEEQNNKLSFNTIMTILNRLLKKGFLKKKKIKHTYSFSAKFSKDEFSKQATANVLSSVLNDSELFTVSSFTGLAKSLDKDTLDKLKKIINEEE